MNDCIVDCNATWWCLVHQDLVLTSYFWPSMCWLLCQAKIMGTRIRRGEKVKEFRKPKDCEFWNHIVLNLKFVTLNEEFCHGLSFYTCWSWIQGPSCFFFSGVLTIWLKFFNCDIHLIMVQAQIWCINSETNRMQTINYYVHHTTRNVSKFDVVDVSGASMMSYILIVWCCITPKNRWVSLSWEILQNFNFCSDPLTYDPIGQLKDNRW